MTDRFGLGWRAELSAGILLHLDSIDVVEVIADDYFAAEPRRVRALRTLAGQCPVLLHGVGLGMASTIPVDENKLDAFARLVDAVRPESWSEHLAFVRAGGIEIGHLAATPRTQPAIEGTLRNLGRAAQRIGSQPAVENIASLIDPPGSTMAEAEWLSRILRDSRAGLLLDLHNVYTNSVNFGYDPIDWLQQIPLDRVQAIHIAGGRPIGKRILDDHLHDVPGIVYDLLRLVAGRTTNPLTVILERDGSYPAIAALLEQLDQARVAVSQGRRSASA